MKLKNIYTQNSSTQISYEVFPPKNDLDYQKTEKLFEEINKLLQFNPALISVTYGAGGSNKNNSFSIVKSLVEKKINIMPHFTCICSDKKSIEFQIQELKKMNIENILALRGDEPQECEVCYRDFRYANELVKFLKETTSFSVGVAGYPEGHIEASDIDTDIKNLKKKVLAGGEVIFTQLFFDNKKLYKYLEKIRKEGIDIPVVAGILPIISYEQLEKMLSLAKVTFPKKLFEKIEKFKNNKDDIKKLGIDFATAQCEDLIKNEIKGLHFYTLNKAFSTSEILKNLNIK